MHEMFTEYLYYNFSYIVKTFPTDFELFIAMRYFFKLYKIVLNYCR